LVVRVAPLCCCGFPDSAFGADVSEDEALVDVESVSSAHATAVDAIAPPTPRKTANAPTLPM
jgi:hypothetical protein